jgi:CBS domain-containing protein
MMTNRNIAFIVKDQNPLTMTAQQTVQIACRRMMERRVGAVLVTDRKHRLTGIFTGRDAVRALAEGKNAAETTLAAAMTPDPRTISPDETAKDALLAMNNGGFRHLPVVADGKILGIVSRGDFKGLELDLLEDEINLWERIG